MSRLLKEAEYAVRLLLPPDRLVLIQWMARFCTHCGRVGEGQGSFRRCDHCDVSWVVGGKREGRASEEPK